MRLQKVVRELSYSSDYKQEKAYGCSAIGVLVALVAIGVIIFGVVFLSGNTYFAFFPFVDSAHIEVTPEFSSLAVSGLTITLVITCATLAGSWLYSQSRQADHEYQQVPDTEDH